jgi:hypothetical protein
MSCVYTPEELQTLSFVPPTEEELEYLTEGDFDVSMTTVRYMSNTYSTPCWCNYHLNDNCVPVPPGSA